MSGRTKQPSFGGVAALFGDDEEDAGSAPKSKKKQPSFGGVAGLFGDDDGDEVGDVSKSASYTNPPAPGKKKAAPSFGGVAAMFGDDGEDEKPPSQIITKPKKAAGRQASFGGVAALFGSGDNEAEPEVPSKGISNLFSGPTATSSETPGNTPGGTAGRETIGALPTKPKAKQRKGKRDPSVSGIASLFGDDDDDEEPNVKSETKDSTVKEAEIHKDLKNQKDELKKRAEDIETKLDLQRSKKEELKSKLKQLQATRDALAVSKKELAMQTAVEMDRMRSIILAGYVPPAGNAASAATVS